MLQKIKNIILANPDKDAFCINDVFTTYSNFASLLSNIRFEIENSCLQTEEMIGIVTYNDIQTYASIFATMFSGYGFVPLNPENPDDRNTEICKHAGVKTILSSKEKPAYIFDKNFISTNNLPDKAIDLSLDNYKKENVACILFTSGSTGVPKGVPLTFENITATLDAFFSLGYKISSEDRFLQMFDFTFDLSMFSYLPALSVGACVYTVPLSGIKYLEAYKVMNKYKVSIAVMVPSTLSFLSPYFKNISLEDVRYSIHGGEAFNIQLAKKWAECIPNAQIINASGPCETTMFCMGYELNNDFNKNKTYNDVLAFGYPWSSNIAIVVDENLKEVTQGEIGELCFSGKNVMNGYWKNPELNKKVFFTKIINGNELRFYRTGDMSFIDKKGMFYSCGRKDFQVKIQGHKVELTEIEKYARRFTGIMNVAAITYEIIPGIFEICLFVEKNNKTKEDLNSYLKKKLPNYMLPKGIIVLDKFPLNNYDKINRKYLLNKILKNEISC